VGDGGQARRRHELRLGVQAGQERVAGVVHQVHQHRRLVGGIGDLRPYQRQAHKPVQRPVVAVLIVGVRIDDEIRPVGAQECGQVVQQVLAGKDGLRVIGRGVGALGAAAVRRAPGIVGGKVLLPQGRQPALRIVQEDDLVRRHAEHLHGVERLLVADLAQAHQVAARREGPLQVDHGRAQIGVTAGGHHHADLAAAGHGLGDQAARPEGLIVHMRRDDQHALVAVQGERVEVGEQHAGEIQVSGGDGEGEDGRHQGQRYQDAEESTRHREAPS